MPNHYNPLITVRPVSGNATTVNEVNRRLGIKPNNTSTTNPLRRKTIRRTRRSARRKTRKNT